MENLNKNTGTGKPASADELKKFSSEAAKEEQKPASADELKKSLGEASKEEPKSFEIIKSLNCIDFIIKNNCLPSKEECTIILEMPTNNQGVKYLQELIKGLLSGYGMSPKADLERLRTFIK